MYRVQGECGWSSLFHPVSKGQYDDDDKNMSTHLVVPSWMGSGGSCDLPEGS